MKKALFILLSLMLMLSCSDDNNSTSLTNTKWRASRGDVSYQIFFGGQSNYYGVYANGQSVYYMFSYEISGSDIILSTEGIWKDDVLIKIKDDTHLIVTNHTENYDLEYTKVKY